MSVRAAAELYRIPKSTLGDRISGRVLPGTASGAVRYLADSEEEELAEFIVGWVIPRPYEIYWLLYSQYWHQGVCTEL